MKTHLNFATRDLGKSVSFYATLLDALPTKVMHDYALFITEEPALELALDLAQEVAVTDDAHYGIYVETASQVDRAIERLEKAGLISTESAVERHETCCYAKQTKVWASDPEGRRWEVYTVHEDTDQRNDSDTNCCSVNDDPRTCCVGQ